MPVEYDRTEDPDIFLEITTQTRRLSLSELEAQLVELNKQIEEIEDSVSADNVTAKQREAIEFYNFQMEDVIRHLIEQRDTLESLIDELKALPERL